MNITETLLREIATGQEDIHEFIGLLSKVGTVQDGVRSIDRALKREEEEYNRKVKDLNEQLERVRRKCDHWVVKWHGDPSGGSDSHYECQICGIQTRNHPGKDKQ